MTYTEDQVVEDEEDAEKEAGESETDVTEPESDSKDEGACNDDTIRIFCLSAASRFTSIISPIALKYLRALQNGGGMSCHVQKRNQQRVVQSER